MHAFPLPTFKQALPFPYLDYQQVKCKEKTLLSFLSSIRTCTNAFAVRSASCHNDSCRNHRDKNVYRQPNGYSVFFTHTHLTIALHLSHSCTQFAILYQNITRPIQLEETQVQINLCSLMSNPSNDKHT